MHIDKHQYWLFGTGGASITTQHLLNQYAEEPLGSLFISRSTKSKLVYKMLN